MRILITGASGFIGSYVVREAIARGHDVLALTRSSPANKLDHVSSVQWLQCDLRDPQAPKLDGLRVDAVIHLAAGLLGSAEEQHRSTVVATRNLLEAMRRALDCYVTYAATIEESGIKRNIPREVVFEVYQETLMRA